MHYVVRRNPENDPLIEGGQKKDVVVTVGRNGNASSVGMNGSNGANGRQIAV